MINPLKVLLFLTGGTAVAAAGAYVSGAFDPLFKDDPQLIASTPADADAGATAPPDTAPKEDRVEGAPVPEQPEIAGEASTAPEISDGTQSPIDESPAADAAGDQPGVVTDSPAENTPADPDVVASEEQPTDSGSPEATPPAEQPGASADTSDVAPADGSGEQTPADVAALDPQAPVADPVAEASAPAVDPAMPTFDIVRVETDGSMVIAGKAAPNAKVELLAGGAVIGSTTADAAGDFVVVLDQPLAPGDYQITIRATKGDNSVQESAQTAIVSVPSGPEGQVLAMIEEPGKPSEIITVPQPNLAAAEEDTSGETNPDQVAAADSGETVEQPGAAGTAEPEDEVLPSDPAESAEDGTSADAAEPTEPAVNDNQAQSPEEAEVAAATPEAEEPAPAAPATATVDVAVEAVEIDGSKVFVAGRAPAGSAVRVYANEILLGDATTSPGGRFLVEADQDLPVGNYVVRVDVLSPDGSEVIARAAVPFMREAGENIAAVAAPAETAPAEQKPAETAASEAGSTKPADGQPTVADASSPGTDAASAEPGPAQPTDVQALDSDMEPAAPTSTADASGTDGEIAAPAEAAVETPPAAEQAPPVAATDGPVSDGDAEPAAVAEAPAPDAQAPAADQSIQPAETAEAETAPSPDAQIPPAGNQPTVDAMPPPAEQPAGGESSVVAAAPPEVTAPPLQNVDSAVIIRRGDTLWRISKRVYGRGVRYSTIYLANQDQIRDPDLIWPGQVFTVPDKTREGETADMSRMGEQVVPKTQ